MKKLIFLFFIIIISFSCKKSNYADLIIYNGIIYTVDSLNNSIESVAIKNDKINHLVEAVGTDAKLILTDSNQVYHVNLCEKILVIVLAKM